jgi:hypothetical protein
MGWFTRKRKELVARAASLTLVAHALNCPVCKGSDYKALCDTGWMLEQNAKVAGADFREALRG